MAIKLIDIYNAVAGQAWSMYDGDIENDDEFESALLSSIQKALTELWCLYPYPFRYKTLDIATIFGVSAYDMPNGNIITVKVDNTKKYSVRLNGKYLDYLQDLSLLSDVHSQPKYFYIQNDKLLFYPIPDDCYNISVEYLTLCIGKNDSGTQIYLLKNGSDYIDIPSKYEAIFQHALITKAMVYAIASQQDENYSGYVDQFNEAYKNLIKYCKGIDTEKRVTW